MPSAPHVIIDDFLPGDLHAGILAHTLALDDFKAGRVVKDGAIDYRPESRKGQLSDDRLGTHLVPFVAALRTAFDQVRAPLGVGTWPFSGVEVRLAAHTDGDFFSPHHDTLTGADRALASKDRIITAVYYFHRQPRRFTGGELRIYPFDRSEPAVIEPRDNRLVAFPSFFLHEVTKVSVPGGEFADSRFSVSCWYQRERTD